MRHHRGRWRRQSRLRPLQMLNSNCVINLEKTKMTYPTSLCFVSCPPSIYFYILLSYAETLLICRANLSIIGRRNSFLPFFLTKNKKTQFICCFPNTMPFVVQDINASLFATFFLGAKKCTGVISPCHCMVSYSGKLTSHCPQTPPHKPGHGHSEGCHCLSGPLIYLDMGAEACHMTVN